MKKILILIGTRPEVIKLAPIIHELNRVKYFKPLICISGQHKQMVDQIVNNFVIKPDFTLDVMGYAQTLSDLSSILITKLQKVIDTTKPEVIVVLGDTTTALIGSLVAFYNKIFIVHVEAGLRTDNKYSPYPEEVNRRLIGQMADLHFAPTNVAKKALLQENIDVNSIFVVGNSVIDALLWMKNRILKGEVKVHNSQINFNGKLKTVLITGHRRESFGEGFENICHAVRTLADKYEDVQFVYPVHLNPKVQEPVNRILGGHPRIQLIKPLDYPDFVQLMDQATIIMTDSGGVQEEAPSLGKPVIVLRENTERLEGILAGNSILVGTDKQKIISEVSRLLDNPEICEKMSKINNPYGDGNASKRIVEIMKEKLNT